MDLTPPGSPSLLFLANSTSSPLSWEKPEVTLLKRLREEHPLGPPLSEDSTSAIRGVISQRDPLRRRRISSPYQSGCRAFLSSQHRSKIRRCWLCRNHLVESGVEEGHCVPESRIRHMGPATFECQDQRLIFRRRRTSHRWRCRKPSITALDLVGTILSHWTPSPPPSPQNQRTSSNPGPPVLQFRIP